ncbi:unnamed protein product, partial [Ectocarpus sp. 12 AP-2014]
MYLDATDPVAGAAASEAAAAAIKALGAPTLADGARGAAAQDAKMDAALAKLSSHYPVVTPAASVYEVLGFAAQARHAKNYKDLLAGASDAGVGGVDGGSSSGERDAEGRASQPPLPCTGAGAPASEQRGRAADGANAPEGSNSSNVAGPSSGNGDNTGDTAVSPAAAPASAADGSGDSAYSSGANAEKAASSPDGVVNDKPISSSSSREELDGGVIGGVAAAFADAVAAFTAADSSTPQIDQEPSSESPAKTAVEATPTATPATTPVAATLAVATPEAATPEAVTPAAAAPAAPTAAAPAPAPAPVPEEDSQPPSGAVDPQGEDSPSVADPPTAATATATAKTRTE